ncbi:MAG: hypothetical protein V1816_21655 [Pseudomonadota bacterium]
MSPEEVYQKFIDYMNNPVIEFTESESKMPMITSFITPEEAAFLTGFPMSNKTLEEIAEIKQMDLAELEQKVKALCQKGLIYEAIREDSVKYRLWSAIEMFYRVTYWSGKTEEPAKSTAPYANRYYMEGYIEQRRPFPHPELRAIPINKTVEPSSKYLPFEDVVKILDNYEYFSVSYCPCKTMHGMDPDYDESPFPSEVCLHFDEMGRYCVGNGLGRQITREETLEILKMAADAGLVHGLSNTEEHPETL